MNLTNIWYKKWHLSGSARVKMLIQQVAFTKGWNCDIKVTVPLWKGRSKVWISASHSLELTLA